MMRSAQSQRAFQNSQSAALRALGSMDTQKVMGIMFDRLYTLRNQLLHGGATWNSNVNRCQISRGAEIMGQVVPIVIHLMMNDYQRVWGEAPYLII